MNVPPIIIPNFRPKLLKNHTLLGQHIPDIGEYPRPCPHPPEPTLGVLNVRKTVD